MRITIGLILLSISALLLGACAPIPSLSPTSPPPGATPSPTATPVTEEEPEVEEFRGTIRAIDGSIWKVTTEERTPMVDVSAAEIHNEPVVGLITEFVGVVHGDTILAEEVWVQEIVEETEAEESPEIQ